MPSSSIWLIEKTLTGLLRSSFVSSADGGGWWAAIFRKTPLGVARISTIKGLANAGDTVRPECSGRRMAAVKGHITRDTNEREEVDVELQLFDCGVDWNRTRSTSSCFYCIGSVEDGSSDRMSPALVAALCRHFVPIKQLMLRGQWSVLCCQLIV